LFHTSKFVDQDTGVISGPVYAVLSHGRFLQMIKPDVPIMLSDPSLNEMPSLSNVDLTTLAGNTVYAQCFQAEVIFDRPKETGNLFKLEAYSSDVMPQ
jgi:hypothetical protein